MDARTYFRLTDAIAASRTSDDLDALREVIERTDMHPLERRVLERALRSRRDALCLIDTPGTATRAHAGD